MAEFKQRLQLNNIDLSAILSDINNLPPAGTEDVTAELNAQTAAVNTLLNMVNRKIAENNGAGEWVWKKAWKYTINLTQTTTGANPTKFKVTGSGNNTDFTDVGFIVGRKFVSDLGHTLEFLDETHVRHTAPNGTVSDYTYTWDAANATVQMPAQWGSQHVFTEQEALRTKEFIVSSGEFDYPDRTYGDDGYYYAQYYEFYDKPEFLKDGVDIFGIIGAMKELNLDELGFSGVACGTFTVPSGLTKLEDIVMYHNLNAVPKIGMVFKIAGTHSKEDVMYLNKVIVFPCMSENGIASTATSVSGGTVVSSITTTSFKNMTAYGWSTEANTNCICDYYMDATEFYLEEGAGNMGYITSYYSSGVTYGWIVLA